MNRIATTPRGFPFDEKTLSELQEQTVPVLNAIARLIPDKSIVYGCNNVSAGGGLERANGFIIWDGELLPFIGGPANANFSIVEDVGERTFNVGTDQDPQLEDHPAYFKRYAKIGTVDGAESVHPFTNLKPKPRFLTYLNKGTRYCGTVVPSVTDNEGTIIEVNYTESVGTAAYMVLANFYRNNSDSQGSFDYDIYDKSATGFKIRIKGITEEITQLFVDYLILPKSSGFYEEIP